jgi:hypothetical protein
MIRLDEFEERKDSSSFNDFQRFLLPIFKDFSKTYKSNQLSKNCKCKQHFHPIISQRPLRTRNRRIIRQDKQSVNILRISSLYVCMAIKYNSFVCGNTTYKVL